MKLAGPATTHEGCAAACGANASLACIQSQEDQELARLVSPSDITSFVWLGEYQYPFEPTIKPELSTPYMGAPYNGQPGWGTCSNGQRAFYQATFWGGYFGYPQPNNYNLGEDCMAWSTAGFADNVCTEHRQCLCEWPSQTSAVYVSTHGPALTQRAHDAFAAQSAEVWRYWRLGIAIGCLPALLLVLVIECYLVRWRQRTAPTTPAEASLKATQRLALRRRMLQGGLSLWVGGVLIGLCIPPAYLTKDGIWPNYGYATTYPYGSPVYWKFLRVPAIMLLLLSIRGTDTAAIRLVAAGCVAYFLVEKLHGYDTWTSWEKTDVFRSHYTSLGPNPEPDPLGELWCEVRGNNYAKCTYVAIMHTLQILVIALMLVPAIFWRRHALPGRIALRWLWNCIRVLWLLIGLEQADRAADLKRISPMMTAMSNAHYVSGFLMMFIAAVLSAKLRQRIQGFLGGFGRGADDASGATAIATMVNGDAISALRSANERLYCIKMSSLVEADMANNQDSGLFQKTEKADTNTTFSFLSHSWRDDATLKWQRMLEFQADWQAAHGGAEPLCWLDKACINQAGDINASLKALPIFLLTSKRFVIFIGESYFKRMWCVLELYTFVRSGGRLEQIELKPLADEKGAAEHAIASLDVSKADCYLRVDKQKILGVIESSFPSLEHFNVTCREILHAKLSGAATTTMSKKKGGKARYQVAPAEVKPASEPASGTK